MKIWTCGVMTLVLATGALGSLVAPAAANPLPRSVIETLAGAIGDVIGAVVSGTAGIGDGDRTKRITVRCDGDKVLSSGNNWTWSEEGSGAWLGVHLQDLDRELREAMDLDDRDGVLVSDVVEDSPADRAGLESGDVIYQIDDREIRSASKLAKYVRKKDPGDKVEVHFYRDGDKKTAKVELGERENEISRSIQIWDDDEPWMSGFEILMRPRLGVVVQSLDEDLASYFDVKEGEGVLVTKVMEDTPAEVARIKTGDVIVKIGDQDVQDAGDIRDALSDTDAGDRVRVEIVRKGKKQSIDVELEEDSETSSSDHHFLMNPRPFHGAPFVKSIPDIRVEKLLNDDELEDLEEELDRVKEELRELREELREMRQRDRE